MDAHIFGNDGRLVYVDISDVDFYPLRQYNVVVYTDGEITRAGVKVARFIHSKAYESTIQHWNLLGSNKNGLVWEYSPVKAG